MSRPAENWIRMLPQRQQANLAKSAEAVDFELEELLFSAEATRNHLSNQ